MGITNRSCETSLRLSELSARRPALSEFLAAVASISNGLFDNLDPFGCAVTVSVSGSPFTASASNSEVFTLNQVMIADDLPTTLGTTTATVCDDFRLDNRWSHPSFVIDKAHVGSVLRVPLLCLQPPILGSLTFYSPDVARFEQRHVDEATVHATEVSIGLNQAIMISQWQQTAESVKLAVADRALVNTAIGIIMHTRNYTRSEAKHHLALLARTQSLTTVEVAAAIVGSLS